jgi:hypothetical protein
VYAPDVKGFIGETIVASELHRLQSEDCVVLNDVLISVGSGSSQIDHVVVSIYGIFVIETKNYKGWIHGNEQSEYWTQSIYKKKTQFRNPIKQNWAHIYALKKALSCFEQAKYHSIVVFAGSAKLKNVSSQVPVVYDYQLVQTIMGYRGTPILSAVQVNAIVEKLKSIMLQDKESHISQVKNHARGFKTVVKSTVCPRCGGNLVARDGCYGKFFGCSSYPKCTYTQNYGAR